MSYLFAPPPPPSLPILDSDLVFPIRRVFCVGRNYAAHAAEMGNEVDREAPFYFLKSAHHVLFADGSDVPVPPRTENYHHEIELVAALDKGGSGIAVGARTAEDAPRARPPTGHGIDSGAGFGPAEDPLVVGVAEAPDEDHEQVDEPPDAESAEGDELQEGGAGLAHVEAVSAEVAEEPAEQQGDETGLLRVVFHREGRSARKGGEADRLVVTDDQIACSVGLRTRDSEESSGRAGSWRSTRASSRCRCPGR